jgi:hypothetical protein
MAGLEGNPYIMQCVFIIISFGIAMTKNAKAAQQGRVNFFL